MAQEFLDLHPAAPAGQAAAAATAVVALELGKTKEI
jgi:hypothetical protein